MQRSSSLQTLRKQGHPFEYVHVSQSCGARTFEFLCLDVAMMEMCRAEQEATENGSERFRYPNLLPGSSRLDTPWSTALDIVSSKA